MNIFRRLLAKTHSVVFQRNRTQRIEELYRRSPEYAEYLSVLMNGAAVGVRGHPWRALDIEAVLQLIQPKRIVELGSGTSTGVFASFTRGRHDVRLLSVDESEHWAKLTQEGLEAVGLGPHPRISIMSSPRCEGARGSFYDFELDDAIDLLYIDGPSVSKRNGKNTPNEDILFAFDRGNFPKAILVDGRIQTVDAIRSHDGGRRYRFIPGMSYLLKAPKLKGADVLNLGRFHRHSLFIRRDFSS